MAILFPADILYQRTHLALCHSFVCCIVAVCICTGEATHSSVNPCVQAALETGERAAAQAAAALNPTSSRL